MGARSITCARNSKVAMTVMLVVGIDSTATSAVYILLRFLLFINRADPISDIIR